MVFLYNVAGRMGCQWLLFWPAQISQISLLLKNYKKAITGKDPEIKYSPLLRGNNSPKVHL